MKKNNKIKAENEKAAYQILSLLFLRNLWITIACMLWLNCKYSRRKPSKEVTLLQEHHLGWQWWCTIRQGSPKYHDPVHIPWSGGWKSLHSHLLPLPKGYRRAHGASRRIHSSPWTQPAFGASKGSISTEKHHLDSWSLRQKFPDTSCWSCSPLRC